MTAEQSQQRDPWFRTRSGLVLLAFLGIAGFFLVTEHTAHLLGALPYLLLVACPLLHFFHRAHGGHDEHGADDRRSGGEKGR